MGGLDPAIQKEQRVFGWLGHARAMTGSALGLAFLRAKIGRDGMLRLKLIPPPIPSAASISPPQPPCLPAPRRAKDPCVPAPRRMVSLTLPPILHRVESRRGGLFSKLWKPWRLQDPNAVLLEKAKAIPHLTPFRSLSAVGPNIVDRFLKDGTIVIGRHLNHVNEFQPARFNGRDGLFR
jgi:hypothetical protein